MRSFVRRLLALGAVAGVLVACGPEPKKTEPAQGDLDINNIRLELKQARRQAADNRESLEKLRVMVEERIATMESSVDSLERTLTEIDRLVGSIEGKTPSPTRARTSGTEMGAGWIILIILILMVALIFVFKARQTRQEAEMDAWPETGQGTGGEKFSRPERPVYDSGGASETSAINIPPRHPSGESKKQD